MSKRILGKAIKKSTRIKRIDFFSFLDCLFFCQYINMSVEIVVRFENSTLQLFEWKPMVYFPYFLSYSLRNNPMKFSSSCFFSISSFVLRFLIIFFVQEYWKGNLISTKQLFWEFFADAICREEKRILFIKKIKKNRKWVKK